MRRVRTLCSAALVTLALAIPRGAPAHPLAPALLDVRQRADGQLDVGWKTPLFRPRGTVLAPALPARCHAVGPQTESQDGGGIWTRWVAACGPGGLVGERFGITGDDAAGIGALVRIELADGRVVEGVVTPARPLLTVPELPSRIGVVRDYARLGVEHILTGPDHLLFVFGLVLLARGGRRLLATVTAFTAGHSVTLSLAALGIVDWPPRLIEPAIAATVLALAVELARQPTSPTLMRRRPWVMAAAFGLLHGLGFAGALREAGLPAGEIPLALVSFNVGIEAGQLVFVAAVLAVRAAVNRLAAGVPAWARTGAVYAMGSLAAAWWIERTLGASW
jgi:hydrogenase/urease accessory protein HupE